MTNDPRLTEALTSPSLKIEKEYVVTLDRAHTGRFLNAMKRGVGILIPTKDDVLRNYKTLPAKIKKIGSKQFAIILTEGKKRQIRLMCKALGYKVLDLERVRVGNIKLEGLKSGKYRKLKIEDFGLDKSPDL